MSYKDRGSPILLESGLKSFLGHPGHNFPLINGQAGERSQTREHDKSIQCYDCNSEYDPRCGLDFDNYTIGIVNCNEKRKLDHMQMAIPVLCRKVVQKVHGKIRVIRGCGYITDAEHDDKECYTRSGTHDVKVTYCSCTSNLCNTGQVVHSAINLIGTAILALMTVIRMAN